MAWLAKHRGFVTAQGAELRCRKHCATASVVLIMAMQRSTTPGSSIVRATAGRPDSAASGINDMLRYHEAIDKQPPGLHVSDGLTLPQQSREIMYNYGCNEEGLAY